LAPPDTEDRDVISAIVFDFDGVIVDSEPLHLRAYQEVLEPRGISLPREEYYAKYLGYDDATAGDVLYPGASECLARLAAKWPIGIASGALRHEIETTIRGNALDRYVRFIVASGETPASKPAPDPYARAAALHGVPPSQCLAIEDSRWGIESAKAAGLWCIGITNTYPVSELMQADAIITSLDELTEALIGSL
jgi:beta-phosphoglucomutase